MCSNCIGSGYLIPHDAAKCPFKSSLHCSHCGTYGHTIDTCIDFMAAAPYNRPMFVEQLISLEDRERYGITSRTPIPAPLTPFGPTAGTLQVFKEAKVLREFLVAHGIKPGSKTNMKILEGQMHEFAKHDGRRLFLIPRPSVDGKAKVEAYLGEEVLAASDT